MVGGFLKKQRSFSEPEANRVPVALMECKTRLNKENMCETGALGKVGEKDECFTYTTTEMLSSGVNFKCAVSLKIF